MKKELEIKEGHYYHIKKGRERSQPECILKVSIMSKGDLHISGIRISDGAFVYIQRGRFTKEITRKTHPECYL